MITTSRWVESNHLPSLYQSDALTTRATTGKRRVQESNLLGCDPVGGLAGRSLTGRPTLQRSPPHEIAHDSARTPDRRALYGIRTRDLLLDGEASTPLDRQDLRTRRGIRTPNLRLLTTAPLPFGLPGQGSGAYPGAWTTSVSNRARAACKAVLHTCASPLMYHVPAAGFEPATSRLSTWRLCRLGHTGMPCAGSGGLEPPRAGSEPEMLPITSAPKVDRGRKAPARTAMENRTPISTAAGWRSHH